MTTSNSNQKSFFESNQYGGLSVLDRQVIGAPHNDTDTSVLAAVAAGPRVGTQKERIFTYINSRECGATEDEIEVGLGLLRSTVCARVNELTNEGFLQDSGERRETRWHRAAIVWSVRNRPVAATVSVVGNESAESGGDGLED